MNYYKGDVEKGHFIFRNGNKVPLLKCKKEGGGYESILQVTTERNDSIKTYKNGAVSGKLHMAKPGTAPFFYTAILQKEEEEIKMAAEVETMFYTREKLWHGLGVRPGMIYLPIPVKAQKQVDRIPYLLPGLNVIRKEAAGAAVPAFVEMGRQHDNGLLGSGRQGIVGIIARGDMLVTLRIGKGRRDIATKQPVVLIMGKDQVFFYLLQ